jgi:hypothetical protein
MEPGIVKSKGRRGCDLPREGFLAEVNIPLPLAAAHGAAQVVCETASTTDANTRGANALLHFLVDESLDVGLAGKHLHAGAWRMDLFGAPRSGDEEEDLENLAPSGHGQNLCHPGSNPLKMLGRLNDPDKREPASGSRAIGIGSDNVAHVGNLVGDTDTSRPQHDGAIGREIFAACDTTLA